MGEKDNGNNHIPIDVTELTAWERNDNIRFIMLNTIIYHVSTLVC